MMEIMTDTLVAFLKERGFAACREYPDTPFSVEKGTKVVVTAQKARCVSPGLGDYLGVRKGLGGKADSEVYGKMVEAELGLEIFAPFTDLDAAGLCTAAGDELCRLLSEPPVGIRPLELEIGEIKADEGLGAFCCGCRLKCRAFFVAEGQAEQGEFTDFILKGNVNCE